MSAPTASAACTGTARDVQNLSRPPARGSRSLHPDLVRCPRGILPPQRPAAATAPTTTGARGLGGGLRRRAVRAPAAGGPLAEHGRHARRQHRHLQVALDARRRPVVVVAAIDNLIKGTAGAASSPPTSLSACPRPPAFPRGSRTVSVTAPLGFGPQASLPGSSPRARPTSRWWSTTARDAAAGGLHEQPVKAAPVCGRSRSCADGALDASC